MAARTTSRKNSKQTEIVTATETSSSSSPAYELSKPKIFMGMEGHGFNASLLKDGKVVAFVIDDATGGEMDVDFTIQGRVSNSISQIEEKAFGEWCLKHRAYDEKWKSLADTENSHDAILAVIDFLVNEKNNEKNNEKLRKQCETKTVFKVNETFGLGFVSDSNAEKLRDVELFKHVKKDIKKGKTVFQLKNGDIFTMGMAFTPPIKAHIERKHGNNLKRIFNEII